MDSTREQRIIRNSLPVKITNDNDKNTISKLHQHMSAGNTSGLNGIKPIDMTFCTYIAGAYRVLREITDWLQARMIHPAYDKLQVVESELGVLQRAKCLWAIGRSEQHSYLTVLVDRSFP